MDSSILKDMGSFKTELLSAFINTDEICELMLDKSPYTDADVKNLIYTQIFPYLYTDETQTEVLPYICMEVDVPNIPTNTIKNMKLIIWVYCHTGAMQYSKEGYDGTKVDILADMIERKLRASDKFGISKLHLESVTYFSPNKKYYGKQLIYTVPAFKISK